MSGAAGTIDGWIEQIRGLKGFAKAVAPKVGAALLQSVQSDLAAGVDPATGKQWPPTKEGGRRLKNAPSAVTKSVFGATIQLRVTGHHYFHHAGKGHEPVTNMLPQGQLSGKHALAVGSVLEREFRRAMR